MKITVNMMLINLVLSSFANLIQLFALLKRKETVKYYMNLFLFVEFSKFT